MVESGVTDDRMADNRDVDVERHSASAAKGTSRQAIAASGETADQKAIALGHPSYVWRFGQERRLQLIRRYVPLENRRILDVGCGLGMYVAHLREYSDEVYGVDIDPAKVAEAGRTLPHITVSPAETLPFDDEFFDVILLNEVIEHVDDDAATIREACRVLRVGGHIVIYAPNRLYPFETHGAYFGGRYKFGNIPLIGYLPGPLRRIFAPHVRAYLAGDILKLYYDLPLRPVVHTYVYPGFDNIVATRRKLGGLLRKALYWAEHTPFQVFGLSHFVVLQKTGPVADEVTSHDSCFAQMRADLG